MINYQEFFLDNGLRVLVHEDPTTPQVVLNVLYNVGSRDEDENRTGFAHLFEHLMFGGSVNIPNYDTPLQKVGGENNAFTTPDVTNYYLTVPSANIETGFWLESDRMLDLSFDPKVLEVQRKVVVEEFKQRYLNQPYGDAWLKIRPLAYQKHPYRWPTIGKEISHIEKATMEDVRSFFKRFYHPGNAILVVAGDVRISQVKMLCEKWFSDIEKGPDNLRSLPKEPKQQEARLLEVSEKVPVEAIYKVFHMPARFQETYYQADLASDILGRGKSSRLYQELVKERKLFSSISAYITGSLDPGLLVIQGRLSEGITCEQGDQAIQNELEKMLQEGLEPGELDKVKNQAESSLAFSEMTLLNRAMNLAVAAVAGDPDLANQEAAIIRNIKENQLLNTCRDLLGNENSSTLYYRKEQA